MSSSPTATTPASTPITRPGDQGIRRDQGIQRSAGRFRRPSATTAAVLMVLGSCTSLQFGAALAAQLFPVIGAAGATMLRLSLAALFLLGLTRPRVRTWSRPQWAAVLVFGLTLATMNGFFYAAIARIPLGVAVTVEFIGPLTLAAVLSRRARDLVWVAMAGAGVLLFGLDGEAGGAGGLDAVGLGLALVAGACWAFYILASSRVGSLVPGQGGLAVATACAAVVVAPLGAGGVAQAGAEPWVFAVAIAMAVLASVIPYSLEFAALRRLPPSTFGVLLSLEPAIATLAGWLILGQAIGPVGALAVVVVIAASVGSTRSRPEPVRHD